MKYKNRSIIGWLFVVLIFLSVSFRASSGFRHIAFPITSERISREPDINDRRFLQQQKEKMEKAIQRDKDQLNLMALMALILAASCGAWYVKLGRESRQV